MLRRYELILNETQFSFFSVVASYFITQIFVALMIMVPVRHQAIPVKHG